MFLRFQQRICLDHGAVQNPFTGPAFSTLKDAVRRLLPYHTCAGHLPTQDDFNLGQRASVDDCPGDSCRQNDLWKTSSKDPFQDEPSAVVIYKKSESYYKAAAICNNKQLCKFFR